MSAQEAPDFTKNPYIIQSILLLLAPALLAASIYMILGRLIRLLDGEKLSVIHPRWLTKVFVTGDVLSFLAQSAGGGMLAGIARAPARRHLVEIGLLHRRCSPLAAQPIVVRLSWVERSTMP